MTELPESAVGFYAIAQADPDRVAIIDDRGSRTFGSLLTEVNRVTHGLRAAGVGAGQSFACVLGNRAEFIAVLLAAFQSGCYLVPVNRHFTADEIAYVLSDSDSRLVITEPRYADAVATAAKDAELPLHRRVCLEPRPGFIAFDDLKAGQPADLPADRTMGSLMLYTSGTTGRPKGVRRDLMPIDPETLALVLGEMLLKPLHIERGDERHLVSSPLYHSAPGLHSLMALTAGHTLVLPERFEPVETLELVQRHRVTNSFMVPTMFHQLLSLPAETRAAYDTSSLRQIWHSAAPCPVPVKQGIIDWLGPVLIEYYGSTESGPVTIAFSEEWLEHPGTVGRPAPNIDIKIFDESGAELPAGEPGMIYAAGQPDFQYHKDPGKTAGTKRDGYYAPGDIGYLDSDGYLFMCDRRDDLIISGGVNIYPAEIESVLFEHPAVADVAVIGVPNEEWGHTVVALVEPLTDPADPAALSAELREFCEPRLAHYKMPRRFEIRESLPRTATGKLSRRKVRDDYLAELPAT